MRPRFTADDAHRASDEWGANCGPGALAAIAGLTLDEVRPHLHGFDGKLYTNPTMMFGALSSIDVTWRRLPAPEWPTYGLARIQWEGPWTAPGVPMRVRYRYTHWVGSCATADRGIGVWDINAMGNGSGWCSLADWERHLVPYLLREAVPRASGGWHITHGIEVQRP